MKREGDGGQPPSFCHTHHFIVFGPAVVPSQDPSNEEELQKQTLDLLVNFAYRLQMDGLTCQNSHQVSPVVDLVFCEKWKVPKPNTQVHHYLKLLWQWHLAQVQVSARLHQPVQLRFCQFNLMLVCWHLPLLKYPSEASAAWHASPKNYLVQFQKQWGRLTCTPDQVKKLLYCTKQKGSQASTGSSSTQDVSDRKVIHFLKHHMFLWFCFLCGIQVS